MGNNRGKLSDKNFKKVIDKQKIRYYNDDYQNVAQHFAKVTDCKGAVS